MKLAKDARQTLDLAIEALIELLDAIGPDPDAEPSLGATSAIDQEYAWDLDAGQHDDREDEHDGSEPEEESFGPRYDVEARAEVRAANRQAREALQALLQRLRKAPRVRRNRQASIGTLTWERDEDSLGLGRRRT